MALTDRQRKIQWLKDIVAGKVTREELMAKRCVKMNLGDRFVYLVDNEKVSKEEYDRAPKPKKEFKVTLNL